LPRRRVERAQIVGKIGLEEHPALARLGGRHQAEASPAAHFLRMHPKKGGSFMQSERLHVAGISTIE